MKDRRPRPCSDAHTPTYRERPLLCRYSLGLPTERARIVDAPVGEGRLHIMLTVFGSTIRVGAGLCCAFSGAALLGAALPLVAGTGGDGVIAVMFLPIGAGLLWLARRWIGRWAWGIAAVLIGYLGIWNGLHGIASQGVDSGSAGHVAGWLTAAAAIPLVYLALRGRGRPRAEAPTPTASK